MLRKFTFVALVLLCSIGITVLTTKHHIVGSEVGGTKALFSYSNVEDGELFYPSDYLQAGTIVRADGDICTAVGGLSTEARGWPFYFAIDDPNCDSTNIFPVVFVLDTLLFASTISLLLIVVRRLVKF